MRAAVDWLFRDRRTGRIVVAQFPNLPLVLYLVFGAARLVWPAAGVVATVALLWWAGDEILRGVNPFRRMLGGVVAAATLAGLLF